MLRIVWQRHATTKRMKTCGNRVQMLLEGITLKNSVVECLAHYQKPWLMQQKKVQVVSLPETSCANHQNVVQFDSDLTLVVAVWPNFAAPRQIARPSLMQKTKGRWRCLSRTMLGCWGYDNQKSQPFRFVACFFPNRNMHSHWDVPLLSIVPIERICAHFLMFVIYHTWKTYLSIICNCQELVLPLAKMSIELNAQSWLIHISCVLCTCFFFSFAVIMFAIPVTH